jgi:hypothetical protein
VEPVADYPEGLARRVMDWYTSVRASHVAAIEQVRTAYSASIPRIASLPELEQDVDGLPALERIAKAF